MDVKEATRPPHVLIFPLPIQGHMNTMVKFAELLCLAELDITFVVSDFNHTRLLRHTNVHSRFSRYPGFRFETVSDGLPDDHPRAGERVFDLIPALKNVTRPLFRKMMMDKKFLATDTRQPVGCIIADGLLSFVGDFAVEEGIPLIYFRTGAACSFWACFCIQDLIEADEIPVKGNGMDLLVKSVPGMGFIRRRDLPGLCRVNNINEPKLQSIKHESRQTPRARAVIMNTFEDLETPILSQIHTHIPNLYTIGPLHSHLKARLATTPTKVSSSSSSLWEEDRTCMDWLHRQSPKSVIYVSFGSITVVTWDQLLELWYGLVNSGHRFLWVTRPDSIARNDGQSQIPAELEEGMKLRGYMVSWAPQEEVLNHPSVGGFLTHSGWNSTLESIVAGVPMICWPNFADQMTNSRFVSEVWRIGLDMKDTCDRVTIEKMVRDLMEVRKDEFLHRANQMKALATKSVSEGGSSYCNLDRVVEYIKSILSDHAMAGRSSN